MWKKILKFLLWMLIFALVAAAVTGIVLFLGKELEDALVVNAIVFGTWLLIWIIRRIYVRLRARAQAAACRRQAAGGPVAPCGPHAGDRAIRGASARARLPPPCSSRLSKN